MKKEHLLISVLYSICFLLMSCGSDVDEIKLNLVFDKELEGDKYPSYLKDLVMPFEGECELDYLLKPINFIRRDIKKSEKESNAWYFKDFGDNTVEFSKGWLEFYFKDSLVDPYLKQKTKNRNIKLSTYLKEDKSVYIFSEDAEIEVFEGYPIYTSAKDVHKAIKSGMCANKDGEVTILINPKEINSIEQPEEITEEVSETEESKNPCNQKTITTALDLKTDIKEIISLERDYSNRVALAKKVWSKYFSENAYVERHKYLGDQNQDIWDPGQGRDYFINRLAILESITDINIFRIEKSKSNSKISGIFIIECHDSTELQ